jgi:hypothetical protein
MVAGMSKSHKNNKRRLTARERAADVVAVILYDSTMSVAEQVDLVSHTIQLHTSAALARQRYRDIWPSVRRVR